MSLAGGIGVNIATNASSATLAPNLVINAGGLLTLSSANTTGANATADGSAAGTGTSTASDSVGVAIALNLVKATNNAEIAADDMVTANGVTVSALMAGTDTPMDSFGAKATSGASAGKVAVAGSLAINIVQANSATASIDSTSTVNAGGDPVMVLSADTANSVADAEPVNEGATSTGKLGVGVSIALDITPDTTSSTIGDAAALSDASDVTLSAIGTYTETTTAVNGAMASNGTGIGISAAIAIVNNSATATWVHSPIRW